MTTNYREILRLESLGLNKTDIASAAQCARNTVSTTLARAKACGLQWPLPEGMSDKELEERLFPSAPGKVVYKMPDYAHDHREMQRQGVTLTLGLLKLADKYTPERLENACRRAFEYTPQPSYKNIQTILATGQDKIQPEPEPPSSSQYGFTRGAEYYDRRKTEC